MELPGLGKFRHDSQFNWYRSKLIRIPVIGKKGRIIVEGYDEDLKKDDFHLAIANFLSIGNSTLEEVEGFVFQ